MRVALAATVAFAAFGLYPLPASAWYRNGHSAVALIAWRQLADDAIRARAVEILQSHPHRALFLDTGRPEGVPEAEWLFVQAAYWPDWVGMPRAESLSPADAKALSREFHRPQWHFINLPFVHPRDVDKFDEAAILKSTLEPEFDAHGDPRHALAALKYHFERIESEATTPERRALSLCWVLHVIGDLHQPLHACTLIASKETFAPIEFLPPQGDQGGNRLAVKARLEDQKSQTLHSFWDGQGLAGYTYPQVQTQVADWLNDPQFQRTSFEAELRTLTTLDWANESHTLARTAAYETAGQMLPARPLVQGLPPAELAGLVAPNLPEGYAAKAEGIARRRIVLAGYRLADRLNRSLRPPADK